MKLQINLSIPDDVADLSDADIQLAHDRAASKKNKIDLMKAGVLLTISAPLLLIMLFRHSMTKNIYISLLVVVLLVGCFLGGAAQKYFGFRLIVKEMKKIKNSNKSSEPT